MSADNWDVCPQCHANRVEKEVVYGEVSEEEYVASLNKKPEPEKETLREDYSIGINEDGLFFVEYKGRCEKCGFKHKFEHKEQLDIKG